VAGTAGCRVVAGTGTEAGRYPGHSRAETWRLLLGAGQCARNATWRRGLVWAWRRRRGAGTHAHVTARQGRQARDPKVILEQNQPQIQCNFVM
jgi:hypothetical protein